MRLSVFSTLLLLLLCTGANGQVKVANASAPTTNFNTHERYLTLGMGYGYGRRTNIGSSEYASLSLGLYQQVSEVFHLGLSVTYSEHVSIGNGQWQDNIMPFTLDARWKYRSFLAGRVNLFFAGSVGLNHVLNRNYFDGEVSENIRVTNGVFLSPMLTGQFNLTKNMGLLLDIGYRYGANRHYYERNNLDLGNRPTTHFFARTSIFF